MPTAVEKARALGTEVVKSISEMSAAAVSNDQKALPDITARAVALAEAIAALSDELIPEAAPEAPQPAPEPAPAPEPEPAPADPAAPTG